VKYQCTHNPHQRANEHRYYILIYYIRIPTLLQAGYATGLLFITPLGDLVRRRQLILVIVLCSASLSIGLAVTNNVKVFEILSFLVGVVTVTPQILVPLAADLAPPEKRATAIAIVLSGLMFGICKYPL
jgi:predicted MFS family arabinose efflux permease